MIRIVCILIGYLFGLFQTAFIIGKIHGIDIRNYGSGNSGTTNMMRTLGRKWGLVTFAGDCIKCLLACLLVRILFSKTHGDIMILLSMYTAAGCILGHNFPFYLNFRGGKGIAATAGFVFSTGNPWLISLGLLTFFLTLILTGYVSLGSLLVYTGLVIEIIVMGQMGVFGLSKPHLIELYILIILLALLAFWMHRENIARLLAGTERKSSMFRRRKNG